MLMGLAITWTLMVMEVDDADIDCTVSSRCEGQIPGSPMNYLSTFGKLELLGIPQIFYEKITCNSNKEKVFPDLYETTNGEEIKTSTVGTLTTGLTSFNAIPDKIDISQIGYADIAQWYSGEDNSDLRRVRDMDTDADPNPDPDNNFTQAVFKNNISKPDIFSENEFLCCIKLGEDAKLLTNAAPDTPFLKMVTKIKE